MTVRSLPFVRWLQVIQWNPGNTVTGPNQDQRAPPDPGDKLDREILNALLQDVEGNTNKNNTEVAQAKQLQQYNVLVDACDDNKQGPRPRLLVSRKALRLCSVRCDTLRHAVRAFRPASTRPVHRHHL